MNKILLGLALALATICSLTACGSDDKNDSIDKNTANKANKSANWSAANQWYINGQERVTKAANISTNNQAGAAKNIILFVGDGMGISTITAARILDGQLKGSTGEENSLSFESFPHLGLSKTYNVDGQTPDSAGTITAIVTGVKTDVGVISQAEGVTRCNCASSAGQNVMTSLELAAIGGLSTGVVSTARITHATPAATYAHTPERGWESDADLTAEAIANGCKDIAAQLLDFSYGSGINVVMGGGRRAFIPNTVIDNEGNKGEREDKRNLTREWLDKYTHSDYVSNRKEFLALNPMTTDHLLGLFSSSHMQYNIDRISQGGIEEPSLAEMTGKAIDIFNRNGKGFLLIVEAGRIDHAHHKGNAARALHDTIALSEAVRVAMKKTSSQDTLLVVTADHSHVFTMAGYPTRGNPILGLVKSNDSNGLPKVTYSTDSNGLPYTTLGYANGEGFDAPEIDDDVPMIGGRVDLSDVDTLSVDYYQEALVPLKSETHGGEDVGIFAQGPGAHLIQGTVEQNYIFHVMNHAANLVVKAEAAQ